MHEEADTFLTYEMKVLGVVLDRRLSFDSHYYYYYYRKKRFRWRNV